MPLDPLPRLILADDDQDLRSVLCPALSDHFELVASVADGAAAVEAAAVHRPDLVLMDLEMPVKDGIVASREIRDRLPGVKVVVLSAHGSRDHVRAAMAAGARDYVIKPQSPSVIIEVLDRVIRLERRRRELREAASGAPGSGCWPFVHATGGTGQTTLLLGIANELLETGFRVLVVDLCHPFGHMARHLGLDPTSGPLGAWLAMKKLPGPEELLARLAQGIKWVAEHSMLAIRSGMGDF